MLDDDARSPPRTDSGARGQATNPDDAITVVVSTSPADRSDGQVGARSVGNVGIESNDNPDSNRHDSPSFDFGNGFGAADDEHEFPVGDAEEHQLGVGTSSERLGTLDVDLSPWAPLLGLLDSTEREASPGAQPFTPVEGVEGPHALELRAEAMRHYAERGAQRTGTLDRTEVGASDDNRDVVAGRDAVEVDGMLDEHTGHGLVVVADEVETNVGGPLTMRARLEDNVIMAGVMRDEFAGGTLVTAAMSDDMAAGLGLRCTAPLDVWAHGLVGMEERPGTCAADGLLFELAGTLYEREYGPGAYVALVARQQGTVATTMKTGFRPLMKVALGVRNLIPGGGGGGGQASATPPAATLTAPPGGEAGAATLTAADSGESLARGAAGGDDTDEVVSVVRTLETASDAGDVEDLQHPASTADNLDNLARVDAEGGGYQQVAEATEQPLPAAAAPEPDAGAVSGADSASPASGYKKAPELDLTEPGADGYTFQSSYGQLREQVEHYRADSNWRGNLFSREYLQAVDEKASELFQGLGGDPSALAGDNRNYRTANIYAEMQRMLDEAAEAGELHDVVEIRTAMDQLEEFVHGSAVDFAARTDEFAGTALGSQRLPIDPNIDTRKLRTWLEEQKQIAFNACMDPATPSEHLQRWSWTRDYYDQCLQALDAGMNPLAESSEQTFFIQAAKVTPENEKYIAQTTADIIALGLDPNDFDIIPPRAADQDQLDTYLALHDGFVDRLSNPEFHRSAADVGDAYAPALHGPGGPGPDQSGPGSLGLPGGAVDEPDVHPVVGAGDPPPPPPDSPVADPSPGASPSEAAGGRSRAGPPALYDTSLWAEGYDFNAAHDTLRKRNYHYRDTFAFRGNFFMREYIQDIDAQALRLLDKLKGPTDEITTDFGRVAPDVYRTMQRMAEQADAAGDARRATDIRVAMAELERLVDATIAEVATRADEFAGTALGSQRAPIDRHIDTAKLRSWLEEQMQAAVERRAAIPMDEPEADRLAGLEQTYFHEMIHCLDEGTNPLASSNEQIAVIRINKVEPHLAQYADEIAAGRPYPRIQAQDELDLYVRLQELLFAALENPEFHRSLDEMDLDTYAEGPRNRIQQMLDRLGRDTLRPLAGGDIPPPLPAADLTDSAAYVDEVRDRSFARSALAASEETLERQAAGVAEGGAPARGRATVPDPPPPEPSLGIRRTPPDAAAAPVIDERSGRWLLEPYEGPFPAPAPGDATLVRADGPSPRLSDVSWNSGLQVAGDSGIGSAGRTADEGNTSGRFNAAADAGEGGAGARSNLYGEPVPFEGRSLEGASSSGDPKELARPLDGAQPPIEDLSRVEPDPAEPAPKSILRNSDGRRVPDAPLDRRDGIIQMRIDVAQTIRRRFNDGMGDAGSVWRDVLWSGERRDVAATREANARWSEFASAQRTSKVSFSDEPHQILYGSVDPPNTVDRAHAAYYTPRPQGWETARETGFGRLAQGWNEFPFSPREQVVNALQKGEALSPDQIAALGSGLEGYQAAGGVVTSNQYRAMTRMMSDLGDQHQHFRWHMHGAPDSRLIQLIGMLDYAAGAV